jgi:K+-sensing histidine kinase KdpD
MQVGAGRIVAIEMRDSRVAFRALFSVAAVAVVTGAVFALRPAAPVVSLGVLYVVAVVAVAVVCGLAYAIPVAFASMLTFNFLFLPPVHTFALRESQNWVALGVYVLTGVVVGELATRSRRLAREAVAAETLRQSDAVKTAVLRAVSHDLRSPLTAIRTASEGLINPAFGDAERDELLDTIRIEVRRLERLVENLLDLSRLEAGPAVRRPELWPVDALLATALEQLGPDAVRVDVTAAPGIPPVRVDSAQIERALVNLLENAIKFSSPSDPVTVSGSVADGRVRVEIRDRGPGIPEVDRARVFEAFERGSTAVRGTGLGLPIARGFAEANGGTVSIGPGASGATFVLELPAAAGRPVLAR